MWLLLAFIAVPLIEIALFIQVGSLIGLWPTLAVVLLTAILGTALVRAQGIHTLDRLRAAMQTGADPSRDLAHGAMLLFSGLLLLTPGFFTDAIGFALLVPTVRDTVYRRLAEKMVLYSAQTGAAKHAPSAPDAVIDGEFEEIDPDAVPPRPMKQPSGWTHR